MKKGLFAVSGVFGILAIIFYSSSLNHLNSEEARLLGTDTVVNIQGTVFCAACAVICAIFLVGALILHYFEKIDFSNTTSSGYQGGNNRPDTNTYSTVTSPEKKDIPPIAFEGAKPKKEFSESYIVCPDCNLRSSKDYIMKNKKCPKCGKELV